MITSTKKGCLSSKEKGNEEDDIVEMELYNEWVDHPPGRTSESMQGAYAQKCEEKDLEPAEEEIISMFDEFWRDVFGGEYEREGYDRGKHHIQQREDIINQQRAHIQQLQQSLDECYKRIHNLEASLMERDTSQDPSYSHTLTNKTVESKYDSDSGGSGELYSSEEEASTGGESDRDGYCDIREGGSVDTSEMEREYENEDYNQQATQTEFRQFNSDNWWSVDDKPICYYCKKVGHKHWRCRDRWREKRKIKRRSWKVKQIEEKIHQLQHQIKQHETHNLEQTQNKQYSNQHNNQYDMRQNNTQHNKEQQEQQNQLNIKQEHKINAICYEMQWLQQKYALNEAYKHGYFDIDTGRRDYPTYSLDTFFPE